MIFPNPIPVSGTQAYSRCKWCQGRGCISCAAQADIDYKAQFPEGAKPLCTIRPDDTEGMAALASIMGVQGLETACSEAKERLEAKGGLVSALLRSSDEAFTEFRAAMEADEVSKILREKLAALGDRASLTAETSPVAPANPTEPSKPATPSPWRGTCFMNTDAAELIDLALSDAMAYSPTGRVFFLRTVMEKIAEEIQQMAAQLKP